jgi:Domain of unknown function DUF1828
MKNEICRAFCNEIAVREVPAGLAISTAFRRRDGDAVAFYLMRDPLAKGLAHLEDDGETVPYLEACGVDFTTQTRQRAFQELLGEYGAEYDEGEAVIRTRPMKEGDIGKASLKFVALLLRLEDFLLLTQEHVESTFREDAAKRIKDTIGDRATIAEDEPVSPRLAEVKPDMVIRANGRTPVAVFFAQTSQRVNDAIFLQMAALYEAKHPVSVIALLEKESSVNQALRQRAANRLTSVPVYNGDEDVAIQRIEREVVGIEQTIH